ncbi:conserved oligomeric Golgi complex subunit 6-like [Paramacrobiotus metropolitanus]|uniref:conserved oligomeric Golgi complex subunit 6-like n=1 Tax=Paramacrobiotus metropolitanus TaxID=2943436 RepID=UPI0024463C47|nr:conserved oligomeric Golgi complex subunit 6-like [Paramacrobiotus metropolitanus]
MEALSNGDDFHNNHAVDLEEMRTEHPFSLRVRRICETPVNQELFAALNNYGSLATNVREMHGKNLQTEIEKQALAGHKNFKMDMEKVLLNLEQEYAELGIVHSSIVEKIEYLRALKESSRKFMDRSRAIDTALKENDLKLRLAKTFFARFMFTSREIDLLTRADYPVNQEFFDALNRTHTIREDCKNLLRLPSASEMLGLHLIESVGKYQETAYQRLYRWCMEESRKLTGETPVVTPLFCHALEVLSFRPAILGAVLEEYALIRKTYLLNAFISALTQGSSMSARPLELHSYDTLRYATDILGWIHQAVATEKDYWSSLTRNVPQAVADSQMCQVMNMITEGLVGALKSRIDRILQSSPSPVVLYKIRHWINFYIGKIRQSVKNDENALVKLLVESATAVHTHYIAGLKSLAAHIGKKIEVPSESLEPVQSLTSALTLLKEIIVCQQTLHADDREAGQDADILIGIVLEPLLQMCNESASHVTPYSPSVSAVYLLNCLYLVQSTLFSGDRLLGDPRSNLIKQQCEAHIDTLVNSIVHSVLTSVRMRPLLETLKSPEETRVIPDDLEMEQFLTLFDRYLASSDEYNSSELRLLMSVPTRNLISQRSQRVISELYEQLYPALMGSRFAGVVKNPDLVKRLLST